VPLVNFANYCKALLVYTNDLVVAQILAGALRDPVMLGGRVSPHDLATHGDETITALQCYRTEFGPIGVGGLSAEAGLTGFSFEGATLRNTMLTHAQQPLLLADHTKFGIIGQVALDQLLPMHGSWLISPRQTIFWWRRPIWLGSIDNAGQS